MELEFKHTIIYEKNLQAFENPAYEVIVNQGGSRSSKTYSICQLLIFLCLTKYTDATITITRKTLPALRFSAMKDFFSILHKLRIYDKNNHNKSDNIYRIKSNEICFSSVDDEQKIRGRKHTIAWLNEANEMDLEDYRQIALRTTDKIFLDYNPSDENHWIYDEVLTKKETVFIQSTYKDNPFLENRIIREIERYQITDRNYWSIYGLGERAISNVKIYHNYKFLDKEKWVEPEEIFYGLDFGYNNPSALVEISVKDNTYYIKELLYKEYLTTKDIIQVLKEKIPVTSREIYCDAAEPDRIEEIKRAGFNAKPAKKDVEAGIAYLKGLRLYICSSSENLTKEIKRYSWKTDKDNKVLESPVKINDHAMDAMRYAIYTRHKLYRQSVTEQDIRTLQEDWQQARQSSW